ncbi:MAG: protein kinase [Oscillospiraceae bacterium]|nr:protein kinase [Oscillospiraceae bacterium]
MEQAQKILNDAWAEWTIEEKLGEGTFGKVYKIKREYLDREQFAALKIIRVSQNETVNGLNFSFDDKSFVDEIICEIELMAKFKGNSNIVSYEDHMVIEEPDGMGWTILIRMELLTPLGKYLEHNEISAEMSIKIGIDLCKALEVLNKQRIIHRDIKLENIFVSENGDFKLGDFGTARIIEKTVDNRTKTGTYMYMAPEVLKSEPYGVKADIYSLGILLYYLLNHQRFPFFPPYPEPVTFESQKAAFNKRISGQAMPQPDSADKNLSAIVLKACEFESKNRFSSAHEMRLALELLIPEEKTDIPVVRPKRKKKGIIIAGVALLTIAIVASAAVISAINKKPDDAYESIGTVAAKDYLEYKILPDGVHITGLLEEREAVEIPEKIEEISVISIDKDAFANGKMKTVSFPDTLISIEECAFISCVNLKGVVLPESLKSIGARAFENCSALVSVDLPDGLETIGDKAFKNCTTLVNISVPAGIKNSGTDVFAYTPFEKNRRYMADTYSKNLSNLSGAKYSLCDIDGNGVEELLVFGSTDLSVSHSQVLIIYEFENEYDSVSPEPSPGSINVDLSPIILTQYGQKIYNSYSHIYHSEADGCLYGCVYNDGYETIYKITLENGTVSETMYQESKYVGENTSKLGNEIIFNVDVEDSSLINEVVLRGIADSQKSN